MSLDELTLEEAARNELKEARNQKEMMLNLVNFAPYKYVVELLQKQIDARIHEILGMPMSRDDEVKRTYSSGEIAGIKIAMEFPKILLEGAIETIELEKRNENEEFRNGQEE